MTEHDDDMVRAAIVDATALIERVRDLERALTPFANSARSYSPDQGWEDSDNVKAWNGTVITVGHLWNAAEVLAKVPR